MTLSQIADTAGNAGTAMPGGVPDTLAAAGPGAGPLAVTAETVYGPLSSHAAPDIGSGIIQHAGSVVTGDIAYNTLVLSCFIGYCVVLYAFRGYILMTFNVMRGRTATGKMLDERSRVFGRFLSWMTALGIVMTGLAGLRLAEMYLGAGIFSAVPEWGLPLLAPAACCLTLLVWGLQYAILKLSGAATLWHEFTGQLFYLKKIMAAMWAVATMPVFLFFALSAAPAAGFLGAAVCVMTGLTLIFLIIRTFILFKDQNLSILHWILYLCAVEIFPVSLAITILGKIFW